MKARALEELRGRELAAAVVLAAVLGLLLMLAPALDQPLDARTQEWLRAFQAAQDLKADGVAGPRTYMRLNQLSGVAEPRLLAAAATGN